MRDNAWLKEKLETVWREYFSDVEEKNKVTIVFGRQARTRLGSIHRLRNEGVNPGSEIIITGYFRDETVPEAVIEGVIAHELCHYTHGFCSAHPQKYKLPHAGKVVELELRKRGLSPIMKAQNLWLKTHWPTFAPAPARKAKRRPTTKRSLLQKLVYELMN